MDSNLRKGLLKVDQKSTQIQNQNLQNIQLGNEDRSIKEKKKHINSFHKVIEDAEKSFMNQNLQENRKQLFNNIKSSLKLEKTIKRSKAETLLLPSIRIWPLQLKDLKTVDIFKTIVSGVILSMIIIPQSMAYSIMIGVPAQYGVYSAGLGAVVYSLIGSSRHASVGPNTTNFLMISKAVKECLDIGYSEEQQVVALQEIAVLIGICLVAMAVVNLGFIENAFSVPAFSGYLKAVNMIIFVEQIAKVLGLSPEGSNMFIKSYSLATQLPKGSVSALCLAMVVFLLLLTAKVLQNRNNKQNLVLQLCPLVITLLGTVLLFVTGLTQYFQTASSFPQSLPSPKVPFSNKRITMKLIPEAIKIALVSFSEAINICKQVAQQQSYHIATSHELYAYGLANILAPFFGGFTTFVSVVRTPLNVQLGCQSQLGALVSGLVILSTCCFMAPAIRIVPIPLISAIVAFSALVNALQYQQVLLWARYYRKDFVMFLVSFGLSLTFNLADALLLSAVISLLWILKRNSKPNWFFHQFPIDDQSEMEQKYKQYSQQQQQPLNANGIQSCNYQQKSPININCINQLDFVRQISVDDQNAIPKEFIQQIASINSISQEQNTLNDYPTFSVNTQIIFNIKTKY